MFSLKVYKKDAQMEKAAYGFGLFFRVGLWVFFSFYFFQSYQEQSKGLSKTFEK